MTNQITTARQIELLHMQDKLRSIRRQRGWALWAIWAISWLGLLWWVWTTPHLQ